MSVMTQPTYSIHNVKLGIVHGERYASCDFSIVSLGNTRPLILFKMNARVIRSSD